MRVVTEIRTPSPSFFLKHKFKLEIKKKSFGKPPLLLLHLFHVFLNSNP